MLNCNKCNKEFKLKHHLQQHIIRIRPCKKNNNINEDDDITNNKNYPKILKMMKISYPKLSM